MELAGGHLRCGCRPAAYTRPAAEASSTRAAAWGGRAARDHRKSDNRKDANGCQTPLLLLLPIRVPAAEEHLRRAGLRHTSRNRAEPLAAGQLPPSPLPRELFYTEVDKDHSRGRTGLSGPTRPPVRSPSSRTAAADLSRADRCEPTTTAIARSMLTDDGGRCEVDANR